MPEFQPLESPERRWWPRRAVRIGVTVYAGDDAGTAHSLDVSAGGIRLESPRRLAVGTATTVIVPVPGGDPVMTPAHVLEATEVGRGWVCRLAFDGLRPRDARRLSAFVMSTDPGGDRPRQDR